MSGGRQRSELPDDAPRHLPGTEELKSKDDSREFLLKDLSVNPSEIGELQKRLLMASVLIQLPDFTVTPHPSTIPYIKSHLQGRSSLVWMDEHMLNAAFAVYSHQEYESVAVFATQVARLLGARVVRADIGGMLTSAESPFLKA